MDQGILEDALILPFTAAVAQEIKILWGGFSRYRI